MISEFELVFGPRKQYRMSLDVNFLCDLTQLTFMYKVGTRTRTEVLRFQDGILLLGVFPVTDKDGRKVRRVLTKGEPTNVVWA